MAKKENKPKKELVRAAVVRLTGEHGFYDDVNADILSKGGMVHFALPVDKPGDYVLHCEIRLIKIKDFYKPGN